MWLRNLPHPLRDGHGRQGRPPHHGHHPRGHPLHKIQDSAEYEEVIGIKETIRECLQFRNKERDMCNIISKTLFYYQKEIKCF